MHLTWMESVFFGLVSGITEFLPVSSHAHQRLMMHIFGVHDYDSARSLVVHIALLLSLYLSFRKQTSQIRRHGGTQNNRRYLPQNAYDLRLVKNAAVPMMICICVFTYIFNIIDELPVVVICLIVNGIFLFLPERMMVGNKDARSMTFFDSLLIGIVGALSAFAGISRLSTVMLVSQARGADRAKSLNWALMLSVPALIMLIIIDFFSIITDGILAGFWSNFIGYAFTGIGAFSAGYVSIGVIKSLNARSGYGNFAYYSWGVALLTFLLYLAVV